MKNFVCRPAEVTRLWLIYDVRFTIYESDYISSTPRKS
jgi:hypothetical protein